MAGRALPAALADSSIAHSSSSGSPVGWLVRAGEIRRASVNPLPPWRTDAITKAGFGHLIRLLGGSGFVPHWTSGYSVKTESGSISDQETTMSPPPPIATLTSWGITDAGAV